MGKDYFLKEVHKSYEENIYVFISIYFMYKYIRM